jgi:hypothetical protein
MSDHDECYHTITCYSLFAAVVAWANFKQQRWECETKAHGRSPSYLAPPVFDPVDNSTIHLRAQIARSISPKIIFRQRLFPKKWNFSWHEGIAVVEPRILSSNQRTRSCYYSENITLYSATFTGTLGIPSNSI